MDTTPSPTLLCIPDISGFTQFMSDTEIATSSKVIPSLLNKIIYSNEIGLKVSEIEGDAVLFFRPGDLPSLAALVNQCKYFYLEFYKQLHSLRNNNPDESELKDLPDRLGLKIILHYGKEISAVPVGKSIKLMGEDVIIAHRLLKNDISSDEYILLSSELLSYYDQEEIEQHFNWDKLHTTQSEYDHIGPIGYHYIFMDKLI